MRVSNGGKKNVNNKGTKSTLSSIEDKVTSGKSSINKGKSTQKVSKKVNTVKVEETREERVIQPKVETPVKDTLEPEEHRLEQVVQEVEKPKEKEKKPKSNVKIKRTLGKLSKGRVTFMVLTGIVSSTMITGLVYGTYYNQVRYPRMMTYDEDSSGLGGIKRWVSAINSLSNTTIKGITESDSYLAKELNYANGDKNKEKLIEKLISTVSYEPEQVVALNKYGNPMLERGTNKEVQIDSLVNGKDEKVILHYIDYSKVDLDSKKIAEIMKKHKLKLGDVDYSNKLVDVFVEYMLSLEDKDIPLVSEEHIPSMEKRSGKYYMTKDEDIYLDKALFSSKDFFDFLTRFSLVAGGSEDGKEGEKGNIQPRKEWLEWDSKSDKEKEDTVEPVKYDDKQLINMEWCGAFYLLNDYEITDKDGNVIKKPISAGIGDGTKDNPAGLNTDIVTYIYSMEKDEKTGEEVRVANPIRVRLVDYKVSQEALDYFETKDDRNRGYDIKSEVQYISYAIEITNLTDKEIIIYDDSTLADGLANKAPRTGTVFGLKDSLKLGAYESGKIESWGSSTELNKKYLIWGSDFKREKPVVWFRVLAGNIDDKSEDKGVSLNNSRYADSEESSDSDSKETTTLD